MRDWITATDVVIAFATFLCSRAGLIYLVIFSTVTAVILWPSLGVVSLWSSLGLAFGGHLLLLVVLGAGAVIGDGIARWLNDRFFHLSPQSAAHRLLFFALSCLTLVLGALLATLGDI